MVSRFLSGFCLFNFG